MNREERFRLGRLLHKQRQAAGLTLEQLEDRSGVSRRTISDIERGKVTGQAEKLRAIAEALDFPIDAPTWQDDLDPDVRNFLVLLGEMLNRLPATQRAETMRQVTATVAADLSRSAQAG